MTINEYLATLDAQSASMRPMAELGLRPGDLAVSSVPAGPGFGVVTRVTQRHVDIVWLGDVGDCSRESCLALAYAAPVRCAFVTGPR